MNFLSSLFSTINNRNDPVQNIEESKHSKSYSDLLDVYVQSVQLNMRLKKWFKILFFAITMTILVAIVVIFALSLVYACKKYSKINNINIEAIASIVTIILPSICSLIIAFIKIPEIIAKYLFNIQEDKYMNSVIKNIQDYDKSMFALNQKANDSVLMHRTEMTQDEAVETSPRENMA